MTASADKVQYLLQNSLEQSVGLVRKGIFTQQQLQAIMLRREKCENAMLKKQYKMTDYLGSIQYEYQLERERRKRMSEIAKLEEGSNPLFRKQSSADYAIVKRIIRLWDRTMHKYKFKLHLWKQYLSFTIAINSKKHFYKVLTNGLKFLPYEIDLWKIGATYEMEYGMNMWKGRRILIKGLKMVPQGENNISLAQFMIDYELHFLKVLLERKNILIKGQQPLKMIGQDQENLNSQEEQQDAQPVETMNLDKYDELIWLILEEAITKNTKPGSKEFSIHQIKSRFLKFLKKKKQQESNSEAKVVIVKAITKLNIFEFPMHEDPQVKPESQFKIEGDEPQNTSFNKSQDLNLWKQKILEEGIKINWHIAQQALKTFCLKPIESSDLLDFLLRVNTNETINYLLTKRINQKFPEGILLKLIELYIADSSEQLAKLIKIQIDRFITPSDLKNESQLFEKIAQFNAKQGRLESTTRLLRSLSIAYSHQHQYLSQCNKISSKTA